MLQIDAPLPIDLVGSLPGQDVVLDHAIRVNASRWQLALAERHLPPIQGQLGQADQAMVTRREVFSYADQEINAGNAFQLLYYSLAWGLGPRAWRLQARLDSIAEHRNSAAELLVSAWHSLRSGASTQDTYSILTTNSGSGRIPLFGPAFSTKFLYFAQGSRRDKEYLILDKVVAENLHRDAWPDAPTAAWWPETYSKYCSLLSRWALEASSDPRLDRLVTPDQFEFAIFNRGDASA